ncbi:MAG: ester cyclase, partial [Pseudomonadota bacterium]
MTDAPTASKMLTAPLRAAMYDFSPAVRTELERLAPDAVFQLAYPFETIEGAGPYYDSAYAPLLDAIPDLERRDHIVIAGPDEAGAQWVGCGGYYLGTFVRPWLDIPPTGHLVHMRFHEFYRIEGDRIVEMQALWDVPEVMMQAGAWPMVPSLGREWHIPGPATQDGLVPGPHDEVASLATRQHIVDML